MTNHLIRTQTLDLQCPDRATSERLGAKAKEIFLDKVLPTLDRLCSDHCPHGEVIRIDRIVIDLGELSEKDLEQRLLQGIATAFEQRLTETTKRNKYISRVEPLFFRETDNSGNTENLRLDALAKRHAEGSLTEELSDNARRKTIPARRLTPEDTELEGFTYVLRHGTSPWWEMQVDPLADVFDRLQRQAPKRLKALLTLEFASSASRRRFCYQLGSEDVVKALNIVQPAAASTSARAHRDLLHRIHNALIEIFPQRIKPTPLVAAEAKLLQLALEASNDDAIELAVDVVRTAIESGVTSIELQKLLDELEIPAAQRKRFRAKPAERRRPAEDVEQIDDVVRTAVESGVTSVELQKRLDKLKIPAAQRKRFRAKLAERHQPAENAEQTDIADTALDDNFVRPNREDQHEDQPTKSATFVENAGVVILWPFLEKFFDHLGLDPIEILIPAISPVRFKAVHLLYLLASGEESVTEPQLPLMKLLCGLNISEPIPARVEFTERDKAEVVQLIQAVLGHWPAMKNTSVRGFRDSFLVRPGKLTPPDRDGTLAGWQLQIERKGFDIIMEQLPWSLHVVKLPWMPEPIYVEW